MKGFNMLSISQNPVPQPVNAPAFKGAEAPKVAKKLVENDEFQKFFIKEVNKIPFRAIENYTKIIMLRCLLSIQNGFKKIGNLFK